MREYCLCASCVRFRSVTSAALESHKPLEGPAWKARSHQLDPSKEGQINTNLIINLVIFHHFILVQIPLAPTRSKMSHFAHRGEVHSVRLSTSWEAQIDRIKAEAELTMVYESLDVEHRLIHSFDRLTEARDHEMFEVTVLGHVN